MKMKQTHVSRVGRYAQIIMALYAVDDMNLTRVLSAYGIAKSLDMKPSTHVKKMCKDLEQQGYLLSMERLDFWGRVMTYYYLKTEVVDELLKLSGSRDEHLKVVKSWFEQ